MGNFTEYYVENGIAYIIMNDPPKRNALSQPMAHEMLEAIEEARFDSNVKVIVLRGAGGFYCAGGDITNMKKRCDSIAKGEKPEAEMRTNMGNLNNLILAIRRVEKPVISWIEGACAGGGMSLALASDFAFAAENVKMSFAFVGVGLAPDMGSTVMLQRRVGPSRATELFMSGRRFTAAEAESLNILTRAVPAEELEAVVMKQAAQLAAGPVLAYAEIKSGVNRIMYWDLHQGMNAETEIGERLSRSADHAEAVNAFLEKRKPVFTGK